MKSKLAEEIRAAITGANCKSSRSATESYHNLVINLLSWHELNLEVEELRKDDDSGCWDQRAVEIVDEIFDDAVERVLDVIRKHFGEDAPEEE